MARSVLTGRTAPPGAPQQLRQAAETAQQNQMDGSLGLSLGGAGGTVDCTSPQQQQQRPPLPPHATAASQASTPSSSDGGLFAFAMTAKKVVTSDTNKATAEALRAIMRKDQHATVGKEMAKEKFKGWLTTAQVPSWKSIEPDDYDQLLEDLAEDLPGL